VAYYDKLVQDPQRASAEFAHRHSLSLDEFERHVDHLLEGATSDGHVTLGDVQAFHSGNATADVSRHVDGCTYCQSLIEALSPESIDDSVGKTWTALKSSGNGAASSAPETGSFGGRYQYPWAIAASVVLAVAVAFLIPGAMRDRESRAVLQALKAENLDLKADVSKLRGNLSALDGQLALVHAQLNAPADAKNLFTLTNAEVLRNFKKSWFVEQKRENPDGMVELKLRPETFGSSAVGVQGAHDVSEGDSIVLGSVGLGDHKEPVAVGVQR
jgi:hypothetical protein